MFFVYPYSKIYLKICDNKKESYEYKDTDFRYFYNGKKSTTGNISINYMNYVNLDT